MKVPRLHFRPVLALVAAGLGVFASAQLFAQDFDDEDSPGYETQLRGPIHEAFAEPLSLDPRPATVTPKQPPEPIDEVPPEVKPEGNAIWIPGYWAWDEEREDFLWISGVWRVAPPGQQWVPGYWTQSDDGYEWVPGFWTSAQSEQLSYLPTPPDTMENGPSSPQPSENHFWVPGAWSWQDANYAWRPGYWSMAQEGWVWIPAHYEWTPYGCVYVAGYWDRPIETRGVMFAPVYFPQPIYRAPRFVYRPRVLINLAAVATNLFVRPRAYHYYFGDYYGNRYAGAGFVPWHQYGTRRGHYDPLYTYQLWNNVRRQPNWVNLQRDQYALRRDRSDLRPPRTLVDQRNLVVKNRTNVDVNIRDQSRHNEMVGVSVKQALEHGGRGPSRDLTLARVERVNTQQEARIQQQAREFRAVRTSRQELEKTGVAELRKSGQLEARRHDRGDEVRDADGAANVNRGAKVAAPQREQKLTLPKRAEAAAVINGRGNDPVGRPGRRDDDNLRGPGQTQPRVNAGPARNDRNPNDRNPNDRTPRDGRSERDVIKAQPAQPKPGAVGTVKIPDNRPPKVENREPRDSRPPKVENREPRDSRPPRDAGGRPENRAPKVDNTPPRDVGGRPENRAPKVDNNPPRDRGPAHGGQPPNREPKPDNRPQHGNKPEVHAPKPDKAPPKNDGNKGGGGGGGGNKGDKGDKGKKGK